MVHLKPFLPENFQQLIDWIKDEKTLVQFAGDIFTFPLTTDQLEKYISDEKRHTFAIISDETRTAIGHCEIYMNHPKVAKLCRILIGDPAHRGKGSGEVAVLKMVDFALNEFKVDTVELNVYDWNHSAIRCYEKAGFVLNPAKVSTTHFQEEIWTSLNMFFLRSSKQ